MSPDETPRQAQFTFLNLAVSKASYRLLPNPVATGARPSTLPVRLEVVASAKLAEAKGTAFVTIDCKIVPDLQWQPYEIEVTVAAAFQATDATPEELLTFCQVAVPSILFPYVREYVHRLTMDAPYGTVKLNPINIAHLLNQTEWAVAESEPIMPVASEPPPPVSQ